MSNSKPKRMKKGQALVEFALFITLVFFLLTAVIDFGMAYFAYQGVAGAAQEGASYAGLMPKNPSAGGFNDADIKLRTRYEAGAPGMTGINPARFVNLLDLDNDRSVWPADQGDENGRITIESIPTEFNDGFISCPTEREKQMCEMRVTVRYRYVPLFFMAKGLGIPEINISATRQAPITQ